MATVKIPVVTVENYSEKCIKVGLEGNGMELDYFFFPKKLTTGYGKTLADGTKVVTDIEVPFWLANEKGIMAKNWDGSKVYLYYIYN